MQWFSCVRCREECVTKARQRAVTDRLAAGPLAAAIQSAKAVCGWMTQPCRHSAQCLPGEPPEVVVDLWREGQGQQSRPPAKERAPQDVRAICERMEALTAQPEHVRAAQEYDHLQAERDARQKADAARTQEMARLDSIKRGREKQKHWWRKQWNEGLRPVAKSPGRLLTRDDYLNFFAGHDRPPAFEQVQSLGVFAVLSGMDAYQRHDKTYDRREKDFFTIARRVQRGFGVDWMTPDQIANEGHTELQWDDKRGPYLAQAGEDESDLPLEWYDGGDSKAWKQQQKKDEWQRRERSRVVEKKADIADLLKGIGR